jgi:hypothetical protein
MENQRAHFFQTLDDMIVAGLPVVQIVRTLDIRERTVRRRKAELGRQGHLTSNQLQGVMPGVACVKTS